MHIPFVERLKIIPEFFGIRPDHGPLYEVIEQIEDVEVRSYDSFRVAQTTFRGPRKEAVEAGFKKLADYIFGNNESHLTLPMTIPLFMDATPEGWMVSFYLDESHEIPTTPDPEIRIHQYKEKLALAYEYSGNQTDEKMNMAKVHLEAMMEKLPEYEMVSNVYWAQYDSPATLPFMKRNEALVHIEKKSLSGTKRA